MRTKTCDLNDGMEDVELKGRIVSKRDFGNLIFLALRDDTGSAQAWLNKSFLGEKFDKNALKYGDFVRLEGNSFKTDSGVTTLNVVNYEVYSRALDPLPDKRKGISKRKGYIHRGLEILTNEETFDRFKKINKMTESIRSFLFQRGYQETDTGILQKEEDSSPSGTFYTYSDHLKKNLVLRKSKEQRMKQLMVGGFEKIFEIGKSFRNGQITRKYHPEINGLELYDAYSDWKDMLSLTVDLLENLNLEFGVPKSNPQEFERINFYDLIKENFGIDGRFASLDEIKKMIPSKRLRNYQNNDTGRAFSLMDLVGFGLERYSNKNIILWGIPKQISVLSKSSIEEPSLAEEFRYFVKGNSFCYGNTELIDPLEQEKRLLEQSRYESKEIDLSKDPFLKLMRLGMPPMGGLGIGLDRLFSIYLEKDSVKDVIYFPL